MNTKKLNRSAVRKAPAMPDDIISVSEEKNLDSFSPTTWANQEATNTTREATPSISREKPSATKGMATPPGNAPTLGRWRNP